MAEYAGHEPIYKDVSSLEVVCYKGGDERFDDGVQYALELLDAIPTAGVVEVDKFASKIAGHSYYHGDKILATLYCLKEGQKIEGSIEPADVVARVHGEWECPCFDISDYWRCSACGEEWFFEYDPTDAETKVNYCPNCGAKMDGKGDCGEKG